ncbi:hypothetical protein F5B18DRAFT_655727 [Nemania serpens]|nr:hypothetical protein F5B18DRAFT_655727 [Nemania serpens]
MHEPLVDSSWNQVDKFSHTHYGAELIQKETFTQQEGLNQIDLIRNTAIPLNARLLADMFYFDLKSDENPDGVLSATDLYSYLLNDSLRSCGCKLVDKLLVQGNSAERVTDTDHLWLCAFGGIGAPVTTVILRDHGVFLRPANASIWSQVQTFFQQGDDAGLHAYVREAQRLTTTQRNVCVAVAPGELEGKLIQPGNAIIMMLDEIRQKSRTQLLSTPKRKISDVPAFSYGQHECLARELALAFIVGLVKLAADLKKLRPAPGQMGQSYLAFDASTWKLHFDDYDKGAFTGERQPTKVMEMQEHYYRIQKRKDELLSGLTS